MNSIQKRSNWKIKLPLVLACFVVGYFFSIQLQVISFLTGSPTTSTRGVELKEEMARLNDQRTTLETELKAIDQQILSLRTSEQEEDLAIQLMQQQLTDYELLSGDREAAGPGIIIQFIDEDASTSNTNSLVYNYDIFLSIINKLNAAKAEAIAINDQRITLYSPIESIDGTLYVNDTAVLPPYEIKAIGNAKNLESTIDMRFGVLWDIRSQHNINTNIIKSEEIIVPRSNMEIDWVYSKPIAKE